MHKLESELVKDLIRNLPHSTFAERGPLQFLTEFNYLRGRADVIAVTKKGEVIAFEAKLDRWREALHQAYRNTCFAHRSYVALPEESAIKASRYVEEFIVRSVGICVIADGEIVVAQDARRLEPIQPWLSKKALAATTGGTTGGSD